MRHPATSLIVYLASAGIVAQSIAGPTLSLSGAINLSLPQWWQFISYMWFHGSPIHFLVNMLVLWPFGKEVEKRMGWMVFVGGYLICGILSALLALPPLPDEGYLIGSSGAVFGVIAMYGVVFWRSKIKWLFLPRPIPVWLFIVLLAIVEVICCCIGYANSIVHLCGLLDGLCFSLGWMWADKKCAKIW